MTRVEQRQPVWAEKATLRAICMAAGESPELIANRTDALLATLQSKFEIAQWKTSGGDTWEGSPQRLADIVHSYVHTDSTGEPQPDSGYLFTVLGTGPRSNLTVQTGAGAPSPGGRIPLHHLTVDLGQLVLNGVSGTDADALCAAVIDAWQPSTVRLADAAVNSTARRGGWKIGVGYRLWINKNVGTVESLAEGLTSTELATGTLISAPDDWSADHVVAAMTTTLTANGLDEIPH